MRRPAAILGTALFFVVAPCTAVLLVPWWLTRWQVQPPFLGLEFTRMIGVLLIVAGLPGLVDSFRRFAVEGLGTPAPFAPPRHLVVTGLYRFVRNPMYVAMISIIAGEALVLGDWRLFVYGALFWLASHIYVVGYEERTLVKTFGAEYDAFRAGVPRWMPRATPWRGDAPDAS